MVSGVARAMVHSSHAHWNPQWLVSVGWHFEGTLYQNCSSVFGGMSWAARTIIMSPMNERRTLLVQAWLMYEAQGQMPRQVNLAMILLWFVALEWRA